MRNSLQREKYTFIQRLIAFSRFLWKFQFHFAFPPHTWDFFYEKYVLSSSGLCWYYYKKELAGKQRLLETSMVTNIISISVFIADFFLELNKATVDQCPGFSELREET